MVRLDDFVADVVKSGLVPASGALARGPCRRAHPSTTRPTGS